MPLYRFLALYRAVYAAPENDPIAQANAERDAIVARQRRFQHPEP